jgi:hypothetical protein
LGVWLALGIDKVVTFVSILVRRLSSGPLSVK